MMLKLIMSWEKLFLCSNKNSGNISELKMFLSTNISTLNTNRMLRTAAPSKRTQFIFFRNSPGPEFLKAATMQNIWEFVQILDQWTQNMKYWHLFHVFVTIGQSFSSFPCLMSFLTHISAKKFPSGHFDCAKKLAFRKSGSESQRLNQGSFCHHRLESQLKQLQLCAVWSDKWAIWSITV